MDAILYEFKSIDHGQKKNYIFQLVQNRRLTNIYHSHDFYELIWFLRGSGTQLINETEYDGEENTIILLRPGDRHCFIRQSEQIEVISLSVKKEEFEVFSNAYDPYLLKLIDSGATPLRFTSFRPSSLDACDRVASSITEYDCKLLLSYFLNAYITETDCLRRGSDLPPMLVLAIEEIKKAENLKRGISAFTELSHYSQSHLSRLIKKFFGVSLKQYINELRLQAAYRDIVITNRSAEEIAEELGFSSFSHFNKIFKARFSITPAALRKNNGAWTI